MPPGIQLRVRSKTKHKYQPNRYTRRKQSTAVKEEKRIRNHAQTNYLLDCRNIHMCKTFGVGGSLNLTKIGHFHSIVACKVPHSPHYGSQQMFLNFGGYLMSIIHICVYERLRRVNYNSTVITVVK